MPRLSRTNHLLVYQNNALVGHLEKQGTGAVGFRYDDAWLRRDNAFPISLSLPLRETAYRGEPVNAVFDNLLPDSDRLRQQIAERVGARGRDAFSLLAEIGRDCVGALRFLTEDDAASLGAVADVVAEPIGDLEIEALIRNLARAPLGIQEDDAFRISIAGAQEKTALLKRNGKWFRPIGNTPTTHIIKTQIGALPNGINLSDSVENEHYCLTLAGLFGLPTNASSIQTFGETTVLVIERFDRAELKSGRIVRLPQEDMCQALSVPSTLKYQSEGGPGMVDILDLLKASDYPARDQTTFMAAQMFFWMIGAPDGHAKNFSIFLKPGGAFELTPLYDILTAQPYADANQLTQRQFKLAMSAGKNRHYRLDEIQPRHFLQTVKKAGAPGHVFYDAARTIVDGWRGAFDGIEQAYGPKFPVPLHESVMVAAGQRLDRLIAAQAEGL